MTPKEHWQPVLSGKQADRVPCDYSGTTEVTKRRLVEMRCESERQLWECQEVDKYIHMARLMLVSTQECPATGRIGCRQVLGGMINNCYREAA